MSIFCNCSLLLQMEVPSYEKKNYCILGGNGEKQQFYCMSQCRIEQNIHPITTLD